MKLILVSVLCLIFFSSIAQISGQVLNGEGRVLNYAIVADLKSKSTCITDSLGFFSINASNLDSLRIQHLGYQSENFVITRNPDKYILIHKTNNLQEIIVSKDYAAWLYFKSYKNTIDKISKGTRDRFYCKAVKTQNKDTLQIRFLDLDFEQKKTGSLSGSVIHNRFIEIQRYIYQQIAIA